MHRNSFRRVPLCLFLSALIVLGLFAHAQAAQSAKYVILFIGDGMALPQRAAAEAFSGKELVMDTLPAQGITTTSANNRYITGSAAAGTALASGVKTNINYIGMGPDYRPERTMAELALKQGKKVGIVSSVSLDHATPAAFYAHVKTRKMYHEIDHALADSGFHFFAGGGLKDPMGKKSENPKGDALAKAKSNGYKVVTNKRDFMKLSPSDGKVIAWNHWLQDSQALPYAMDMTGSDITLAQFTAKGIEMLDNENGFFLMVEGGKIDWACHANDGVAAIRNTLAFDKAVQEGLAFYRKHPEETLIVVTGDHETGGLTLGYAGTKYESNFRILAKQTMSFQKFDDTVMDGFRKRGGSFDDMKQIITREFGLRFQGEKTDPAVLKDFEIEMLRTAFARSMDKPGDKAKGADYLRYGDYEPLTVTLTRLLNQKAGLGWTSYKHTALPVATSAVGVGANSFNGRYDNTDVAASIIRIMGQ